MASKPTVISAKEFREQYLNKGDKKKSKYGNTIVNYDGKRFDSIKEKNRYIELEWLKRSGNIIDFVWQHPMEYRLDGDLIFTYICDFVIKQNDGSVTYEDVKALDKKTGKYITTALFNLKKKIIEKMYNIKIVLK